MNEYINAQDLDDFRDDMISVFFSLCDYNDYNTLTLLQITETVNNIYEKYCYKPLADVEAKRKWISVTDQLPDNYDFVLCYTDYDFCFIGYFGRNTGKWFDSRMTCCDRVTHWMPLPSVPQ